MAVPYQCGVDGLDLVFLKRSEARHLAAQVGVYQYLKQEEKKKNNLIGIGSIQTGKSLGIGVQPPLVRKAFIVAGTIDCLQEQMVFSLISWNATLCIFQVWLKATRWNLDVTKRFWHHYPVTLILVRHSNRNLVVKVCGQTVICRKLAISLSRCSPPAPTARFLTLWAASRLWTKPISVRYFIPDATPVSMSISCMTLSWPSCFWGCRK